MWQKVKGLIHLYCGDGKGKTTAAMGLALRCSGVGKKVLIFQFLKQDTSGERETLGKLPNITLLEGYAKAKFVKNMTDTEKRETKAYYSQRFMEITDMVKQNAYQMLILDEMMSAVNYGFVEEEKLVTFLKEKPEELEVVMTGRNPSKTICGLADYITEMKKVKHPYDKGIMARKGIEY